MSIWLDGITEVGQFLSDLLTSIFDYLSAYPVLLAVFFMPLVCSLLVFIFRLCTDTGFSAFSSARDRRESKRSRNSAAVSSDGSVPDNVVSIDGSQYTRSA